MFWHLIINQDGINIIDQLVSETELQYLCALHADGTMFAVGFHFRPNSNHILCPYEIEIFYTRLP